MADAQTALKFSSEAWDSTIIPTLEEYIRIPNQSPLYDPEWLTNGLLDKATELLANWAKAQNIPNSTLEVVKNEGKSPVIFIEIQGTTPELNKETVLMYGHLDKQPPLTPFWNDGLGPYTPVIKDGKLYGRGGADDGYAVFAALTSIKALQAQGVPHSRIVVLIEASEESGSPHLPEYVEFFIQNGKMGVPSLIVCLDSGCGNYEQLWLTTSLRGMLSGNLTVKILSEGVHSGAASGVVPSSFRIIRQLLSRIEDETTGKVLVPELFTNIPPARIEQARLAAEVLGETLYSEFPFLQGATPMHSDLVDLLLNKTWYPTVSYTGIGGIPDLANAGNVLRPETTLKLSVRLPPGVGGPNAIAGLKKTLEANPPYGAEVSFVADKYGAGWESPALVPWLEQAANEASKLVYDKPVCYMGEGGSIPFMGMLGEKFPKAQFVILGVLGPKSNAHGPNEFLHIDYAKKLTATVSLILAAHGKNSVSA